MQEDRTELVDKFVDKWTPYISPMIFQVEFEDETRDLAFQLITPERSEPATPEAKKGRIRDIEV